MKRTFWLAALIATFTFASQNSQAQPVAQTCEIRMASLDLDRNISNATLESLRADAAVFTSILRDCWTNLQTHEALDHFSLEKRASQLEGALQRPNLTLNQGLDLIHDFVASLHDGHLRFAEQRPSQTLYSGLRFLQTERGLTLIGCESAACAKVKLPATVESIDGKESKQWLSDQSAFSVGSTRPGRLFAAERSLETFESAKVSRARASAHASKRVVRSRAGTRHVVMLNWVSEMPKWQSEAAMAPCASAKVVDGVFILRIEAFFCLTEPVDGVQPPMDAGLIPLMEAAFANAEPFKKIVIDLRGNTGGLPSAAKWLVSRLQSQPHTFYMRTQKRDSGLPLFDEIVDLKASSDRFDDQFRHAPVWIFGDGGCFSQCTILARSLVDSGRARYIGSPIDASAGGPTNWRAPSGSWLVTIPIWTVQDQKGVAIEGAPPKSSIPFSIPFMDAHLGDAGLRAVLRAIR